jgi:N-acetylglucosaminyl-diphospho-decaprenol L-rhamnosyltransferase
MPSRDLASVAVVTVTYNSSDTIRDFLQSVAVAEEHALDVHIVDNDSADWTSTKSIAEEYGAAFTRLGRNLGYGAAVNRAVDTLPKSIRFLLIANPDLIVAPGAVGRLLEVFDDSDRAAVAGPRILNQDGSVYPSARRQPGLRIGIGHALFADVWPGNPWSRAYHQGGATDAAEQREVGWLSGAFLLVDREKFDRIGGFDEQYFMYFEDVDLGRRFLEQGYANVYQPRAEVMHLGGHSTGGSADRMVRAHHESAYVFIRKRYPGPALLPLRLALRAGLAARAAWILRRPRS